MSARHIKRIFSINRVLVKHGLDEYLDNTPAKKYLWILRLLSFGAKAERSKPKGQRLREALTELGPIFVKFGQMLSTRRDLLDEELAIELAQLQDRVPPFSEEQAHQRIEQQLGSSVDSHFVNFERKPLASASMAQVHGATLHSGEEVVVKVIRPGIRKQLKHDLSLILDFANWLEKFVPETRRFKPTHVVKDYEATIFAELDLRVEAANTAQLKRNFENSELLYIPKVYWPLTREKVMVQERIGGIPIGDVKQLIAANTNMRELAHRGVEIFFTQVFRDSFFHADMHPGNIFVDVSNPNKPKYIGIDCGIMGTLGKEDKRYLAQNFLAFFDRDYRRIAELHVLSGWVPHDTSIEAFESAIRTACEPIFGKPLAEISFGHFLVQLFQVARRFEMEVQPQLVLLQKTLLYIEGLGRQLYPQLDLWETAQPFLKDWVKTQYGVKSIIDRVQQKWPTWVEYLPELPELVISALEQQGKDFSQEVSKQNNHSRPSTHSKATVFAIIGGSATILAGCLIVADVWNAAYISLGIGALGFIAALKSKSS